MKSLRKILVVVFIGFLMLFAAPNNLIAQPLSYASTMYSVKYTSMENRLNDATYDEMRARQPIAYNTSNAVTAGLGDYLPQGAKKASENDECSTVDGKYALATTMSISFQQEIDNLLKTAEDLQAQVEQTRKESIGRTIADASYSVASPGANVCAGWVSLVCQAAGYGYPGGNANDMYYRYCFSSDRSILRTGMMIAVPSNDLSDMGRLYGHVGIVIQKDDGSFWVRDNIGYIEETPLDAWIEIYNNISEVKWGWIIN